MAHNPEFLKLVNESKKKIRECTVQDILPRVQKNETFFLVDVREDSEWQAGRIRGALHLGKGVIERDIESKIPDKAAEIVLYCGGGFRSALAAEALQKMGYQNVISMDGGWRVWVEVCGPTEK